MKKEPNRINEESNEPWNVNLISLEVSDIRDSSALDDATIATLPDGPPETIQPIPTGGMTALTVSIPTEDNSNSQIKNETQNEMNDL